MKLLLTSAGIKNKSIRAALDALLPRPLAECTALAIPTAGYGHPMGSAAGAWRFISGNEPNCPMTGLGWKSVGVLELTALPTMDPARWTSAVRNADVLLVNGGDALYLAHWVRASGLADLLPSLQDKVWVGLSAGSMALTPAMGDDFIQWKPPSGQDAGLALVPFSLFPHLGHPKCPDNTLENAEKWAAALPNPGYAIDDDTAIKVVDGTVEVVSEGTWKLFPR